MDVDPSARPLSLPATPERTAGRRIGVLLQHGFTGSPASVRPLGEALAESGYAVEAPRLPGHGTSWRDLNTTTWQDWYAEHTRAFDTLRSCCDAVVVGGLSMGGALALRLAADRPQEVAGVVLVNPAVATERKDVLALPVAKHLIASFPGIGNDIKKPGVTEHGYDRTPLKAAHSMMRAWKPLRADLCRVTAPLLFFRSVEDHVVDPSSSRVILSQVSSHEVTERLLENSYHVATLDHDASAIVTETDAFVRRVASTTSGTSPGAGAE